MFRIFDLDAPLWVFLGEVADFVILALLWWCCCLGIITIGASTTALHYVIGKKIRKEHTYVAKDFFKSFTQNLKQSVPLSIILTLALISLVMYVISVVGGLYAEQQPSYLKFMLPITLFFAVEVVNFHAYTWSLLSRFDMTTKSIIKMTFFMTHRHLLTTLWNVGVAIVVVVCVIEMPFLLIVAPSGMVFGQSFMIQKLFSAYIEAKQMKEVHQEEQEKMILEETIQRM